MWKKQDDVERDQPKQQNAATRLLEDVLSQAGKDDFEKSEVGVPSDVVLAETPIRR